MRIPIEPGESFTIEYGDGHQIEVVGLSYRQKRQVKALAHECVSLPKTSEAVDRLFDICDAVLAIVCPNITDEQRDRLNEEQVMEIGAACVAQLAVDHEAKKNLESQPLSSPNNSAESAKGNVNVPPIETTVDPTSFL